VRFRCCGRGNKPNLTVTRVARFYHVFKGQRFTIAGDNRHDWEEGDTFTVPFWQWHHHGNVSHAAESILFVINDRPVMDAFGFYREEGS
jgi:gentisate 1,2-dioxygenase